MASGTVFDIQRNSTVDGPGIRTAVFFKGCNLRCAWCHNPEGKSRKPQMLHYRDRSVLCGREYTADEIMTEIQKDVLFYNTSGGGVTFSGGECMLQIDFLAELLQRCKALGIHTAVDTAGCVNWLAFEKVLPFTDLFLYDVKTMDPQKHQQYTGVDNVLILENLARLCQAGCSVMIRMPVIPGVNNSTWDVLAVAQLAERMGIGSVELLPYHAMGEYKSNALGEAFVSFQEPSTESMQKLNAVLREESL